MFTGGQSERRSRTVCIMHWMGTWSLALFLVACVSQDTSKPLVSDLQNAQNFFTVGFKYISDIYVEEVAVSDLALAGLRNLARIEKELTVVENDGQITILFDDEEVISFAAPARRDTEGWGSLTAAVLAVGRTRSEALNTAEAEKLYEIVFDGVMDQLDEGSSYAGSAEARYQSESHSEIGTIGVTLRLIEEGIRILSVAQNGPAERAGLLDYDIVTRIDGELTVGLRQREVLNRLRGSLGSKIELTIRRETESAPLVFEAFRAYIIPQTVRFRRLGNVAILRLTGFRRNTARDLREKIRLAFRGFGPELAGFVLDLRGNPGGPLDHVISVADLFIRRGRIVSTHGRHWESDQYFDARPGDVAKGHRLIVLINGNSISGSEIVAAALQDSGRAVVIGSSSFGQGTVRTVMPLPNEGNLTLTWTTLYAPSGYSLNHRGVMPDICTTGKVNTAAELLESLRRGQGLIDRRIRTLNFEPSDKRGLTALRGRCPARGREAEIDLDIAIHLLMDPDLYLRSLAGAS